MDTTTTLTGSARQVAWASDIRQETLDELDQAAGLSDEERAETTRLLRSVTAASWWIEQRHIAGCEWPDLLGARRAACEIRLVERTTEAAQRRLDQRLTTAAQVREALDTAGVPRVGYMLTIGRTDQLSLTQLDTSGTSPEQIAARRAAAERIIAALAGTPWAPRGEHRVVRGNLASGQGVLIVDG